MNLHWTLQALYCFGLLSLASYFAPDSNGVKRLLIRYAEFYLRFSILTISPRSQLLVWAFVSFTLALFFTVMTLAGAT